MPHTKQTKTPPKNQKLKTKKLSAFTLVELIITIVILSILSTIAFLSFNSYSSSSRDSVRLSDINSINKSLELYQVNVWRYPDPTNVYMTVTYSWWAIFEQWKLWDTVITAIWKISKKPVDPLKNTEYTYSANMNNSTYQLKADLEIKPSTWYNDWNNLKDISTALSYAQYDNNMVNAYTNTGSTVCYIQWNFNWLIEKTNTGNTNYILAVPWMIITDTWALTSNTNIDYNTLSWKVICNWLNSPCIINFTPTVVFVWSGNTMPSTVWDMWAIVWWLKNAYSWSNVSTTNSIISNLLTSSWINIISLWASLVWKVWATTTTNLASTIASYPGCDAPDIILDNWQIWAACNVGATVAFTGVNLTATCPSWCTTDPYPSWHNTTWDYYQWGRNKSVTSVTTIWWPRIDDTNLFIANSTSSPYNWYNSIDNSLWWWSVNDTITTDWQPNEILRKWPCASWYHVPSIREWWTTILYLEPTSTYTTWWTPNSTLVSKLKLPFSGNRYIDWKYYYQGLNSYYHSSSPSWNNIADILINNWQIQTNHYSYRVYWSVVRCIKD